MKKELKRILETAEEYKCGTPFDELLIIYSGRLYRGFWYNGKSTKYNHIILLARNKTVYDGFYIINKNYETDLVSIEDEQDIRMDIPKELGCIRIWNMNAKQFVVKYILSDIAVYTYEGEKDNEESTRI